MSQIELWGLREEVRGAITEAKCRRKSLPKGPYASVEQGLLEAMLKIERKLGEMIDMGRR